MRNIALFGLLLLCSRSLPIDIQSDICIVTKDSILVIENKGSDPIVIFPKDMVVPLDLVGFESRYTPSIQDMRMAKSVLIENYNRAHLEDPRVTDFQSSKNVERRLKGYIYQYVGLMNKNSEKILLLQMIKYSKTKRKQKYISSWREEFITGFGKFFEKNREVYIINIEDKELSLF
jgi:hypothetical protein